MIFELWAKDIGNLIKTTYGWFPIIKKRGLACDRVIMCSDGLIKIDFVKFKTKELMRLVP